MEALILVFTYSMKLARNIILNACFYGVARSTRITSGIGRLLLPVSLNLLTVYYICLVKLFEMVYYRYSTLYRYESTSMEW